MDSKAPETHALRGYLMAAVLLALMLGIGLFVWIMSLPPEDLDYLDKCLIAIVLFIFTGKPALDQYLKTRVSSPKLRDRILFALMGGIFIGLTRTETTNGLTETSLQFALGFVLGFGLMWLCDVVIAKAQQKWKEARTPQSSD